MPCDNSVECAQSAVCCYTHMAPLSQRHLASSMQYQQLHIFTCSITESESDISTIAILLIFKKEKKSQISYLSNGYESSSYHPLCLYKQSRLACYVMLHPLIYQKKKKEKASHTNQ